MLLCSIRLISRLCFLLFIQKSWQFVTLLCLLFDIYLLVYLYIKMYVQKLRQNIDLILGWDTTTWCLLWDRHFREISTNNCDDKKYRRDISLQYVVTFFFWCNMCYVNFSILLPFYLKKRRNVFIQADGFLLRTKFSYMYDLRLKIIFFRIKIVIYVQLLDWQTNMGIFCVWKCVRFILGMLCMALDGETHVSLNTRDKFDWRTFI